MRIDCLHGYFIFKEDMAGEVAQFMAQYSLTLVAKDDYYTFPTLENAPDYSIKGAPILGNTATANFEGKPWEVMESNGLVFDLVTGTVKPILSVTTRILISQAGFYFYSDGLINPGSLRSDNKRVNGYRARLKRGTWGFRYSEVSYV